MDGSNCEALSMGKRSWKGDMRKLHDVEGQLCGGQPERDMESQFHGIRIRTNEEKPLGTPCWQDIRKVFSHIQSYPEMD